MFTRLPWSRRAGTPLGLSRASESDRHETPKGAGADEALSKELTNVGLLWAGDRVTAPATPFHGSGAHVAASEFARALTRYGRMRALDIFVPQGTIEEHRRQFYGMPMRFHHGEAAIAHFYPESDIASRLPRNVPDVLHDVSTDLTRSSYIRSRLSRQVFPVTCSQHAISYSFQLHTLFLPLLTAQIYPCDAIVCLTHSSRSAMEKRLLDIAERYSRAWDHAVPRLPRLEVIPWGIDTELFSVRDQLAARRMLDLPPDRPILLCLARVQVHDKMDWTTLLLAFQQVSHLVEQAPLLVLAGSANGGCADYILAQAAHLGLQRNVYTFFNLPPALLPSLYTASDVFVAPTDSPSESFGLTVVEAMACGRPVVASDWDGYREIIVHGETGFKVRTDWADCLGELNDMAPFLSVQQEHLHVGQSVNVDMGQLASYLVQLLENRELREEMGRRGRARVEAFYDWPVIIRQWELLWEELKQVAGTLERSQRDSLDYLLPNYFQHFSHYASRVIDDVVSIRLTPRGSEVLTGQAPLLLHPWSQGLLLPQYLQALLTAVKPGRRPGVDISAGELLDTIAKTYGLSRDRALMHLMWLAKYDLVSLGEEGGSTDESSAS